MPVIRYRSFEQAREALWQYRTGSDYYRQIANLFDFYDRIRPRTYPSGIFKYESLETSDRQQMTWMLDFAPKHKKVPKDDQREKPCPFSLEP